MYQSCGEIELVGIHHTTLFTSLRSLGGIIVAVTLSPW